MYDRKYFEKAGEFLLHTLLRPAFWDPLYEQESGLHRMQKLPDCPPGPSLWSYFAVAVNLFCKKKPYFVKLFCYSVSSDTSTRQDTDPDVSLK